MNTTIMKFGGTSVEGATAFKNVAAIISARQALHPVVYYESDWGSEEWTRGAYAASFDMGGLARYGQDLRMPVGPIHFACSDMAGKGYQHVDGAIRVGREVADEILAAGA